MPGAGLWLAVLVALTIASSATAQGLDPADSGPNVATVALTANDVGGDYFVALESVGPGPTGSTSTVVYLLEGGPDASVTEPFVVRADVLSYTLEGPRPPEVVDVLKRAFMQTYQTASLQFRVINGPLVGNIESVWYEGDNTLQPEAIYYLVVFEVPEGLAAVSVGIWNRAADNTSAIELARTMADRLDALV